MRRAFGIPLLLLVASMTPTAIAQQCTAGTAPSLNLGTYTGAQSTTGAAPGTVNCNKGTAYTIGFGNGTGAGATATIRKMTGNGVTLNYQIFQDAGMTLNWGNIGGSQVLSGTGTGGTQTFTVYPLIPAGQYAPAGTYTDTVSASINDSGIYSENFTVTATVTTTCAISATSLVFGVYTGAQLNSTATVSVTCTNKAPYYVNMGNGQNEDGGWWPWMLGPNGSLLSYRLYQNAGRTTVWRNTYNLDGESWTGTGAANLLTVYGQIPSGQNVAPGSYSDIVVATVTY